MYEMVYNKNKGEFVRIRDVLIRVYNASLFVLLKTKEGAR